MMNFKEPDGAILRQIAEALGVPIERFFTAARPAEAACRTDEVLQLWSGIRTEEGRQRALEALRTIWKQEQQ